MTKHPQRILHLITTLPVGGAERVLLNTVALLNRDEFESVVCCIMQEGELAPEIKKLGIPVIALNLGQKKGWDSTVAPVISKLIQDERIDLVHAHLYHAHLYGRLAALKTNTPCVITVHNTYATTKWHRRLLNWYLGRRTNAILAVSEDIKKDLMHWDHLPERAIQVIPNGISIERMKATLCRAEARERLQLRPEAQVLVCVGRLEQQKGHRYLLQAIPLLNQQGIQPICLFVGEGRERNALLQLAQELGIADQIRLLGTRQDVADILKAADLYVMPSLWEGLSLALLEAMAANIPIIASAVGGMSQVLGDKLGLLVEPKQPEALAEKIAYGLSHSEEMSTMAEQAYDHVCQHFSDQRMVENIADVYRQVLDRHEV